MKRTPATLAAVLIALASTGAPAPAQQTPDAVEPRPLADTREHERGYGISLRPPVGTRMVRRTADDYAMRIADTDGRFLMSLKIKQSDKKLDLKTVTASFAQRLVTADANNNLVSDEDRAIAGHAATVTYYRINEIVELKRGERAGKPQRMMLAQAIIQLDPLTFAVFEARCPLAEAPMVQPTFENVLKTIEIVDPKELEAERKKQIELGRQWRLGVRGEAIHKAMIPEQWYRMIGNENGRATDYGWMRVQQGKSTQTGKPGSKVVIEARLRVGQFYYDSLGEYFLADDDTFETWSNRTTERPIRPRPNTPKDHRYPTVVQTGVRTGGKITIKSEDPTNGVRQRHFLEPETGYLSQVESLMLPQLLPISRATYGFYFYNTQTGSVSYRTETVVPALGNFTLISRANPNAPDLRSTYTAKRALVGKQLDTKGAKLVPSTAAEVQQRWRLR